MRIDGSPFRSYGFIEGGSFVLSLAQPTDRVQARLGRTLRGKYRLDSVLGVGGMGAVYAATHRNTKRYAVKMLHAELSVREDIRTRFLHEGYAANSVGHPGTVEVLDDDVDEEGAAFLVMELLHGAGVDSVWQKYGGKVPTEVALAIVDQLLDVLAAAHAKHIVHRDIKPANLFLTSLGTVKVLDFGIARVRESAVAGEGGTGTATGTTLGSPAFMSPEQAMAKSSDVDARTDLWAAAATLFTLVSGEFVHRGENATQQLIFAATKHARSLASAAPEVPAPVIEVVDRGLVFEKGGRWASAADMRRALREAWVVAGWGGEPDRASLAAVVGQLRGSGSLPPPGRSSAPTPVPSSDPAPAHAPAPGPMTATFGPHPIGPPIVSPHVRQSTSTTARPVEAKKAAPAKRNAGTSRQRWLIPGAAALAAAGAFLALRPKPPQPQQSSGSATTPSQISSGLRANAAIEAPPKPVEPGDEVAADSSSASPVAVAAMDLEAGSATVATPQVAVTTTKMQPPPSVPARAALSFPKAASASAPCKLFKTLDKNGDAHFSCPCARCL